MLIVDKINNYLNSHGSKDSNYNIAMYIQKNIEEISLLNTTQLAERSYVSQATVSRFVQSLGYDTYSDFKDDIIRYLEDTATFDEKDTGLLIHEEVFKLISSHLDLQELTKIADLISDYNNVYVTGINYSYFMGEYLQTECHNFRKVINVLSESSSINTLKETDLLIVISTSGNYFSRKKLAKRKIKACKAHKVLIGVNNIGTPIENLFDKVFLLRANTGNKNSHYLMMAIIDHLIEMIEVNKKIGDN